MIKTVVHFATIGPLPGHGRVENVLTASGTGALTIDGQSLAIGQRILVKDESSAHPEHGVYDVTAVGGSSPPAPWVLTRSIDWVKAKDFEAGTLVVVMGGTQLGHVWVLETLGPITPNTTALRFSRAKSAPAGTHNASLYVTPDGKDSNSGRSLDDALLTIERAIRLLPPTGGDIWYLSGPEPERLIKMRSDGKGLKMIGPADPNYASPPNSEWIQQKPFRLRPLAYSSFNANSTSEGAGRVLGGSYTDIRNPALWFAGTTCHIVLQNTDFAGGPVRTWGPSDMGFGPGKDYGAQLAYFDVAIVTKVADIEHCPANIGGVTLQDGWRVLLANQANVAVNSFGFANPNRPVGYSCAHAHNGPYKATDRGDGTFRLDRVADFNSPEELQAGCLTWVREGDHAGIWAISVAVLDRRSRDSQWDDAAHKRKCVFELCSAACIHDRRATVVRCDRERL